MESPATKLPDLMWSFNGTINSVQHEYPTPASVSADEAEMISQLLTSYSISNDQTVSAWSYDQGPLNMVEGEESLSSVYFPSDSANTSLYYWLPQSAPDQEYAMCSNTTKDLTSYYLGSDQRASRSLQGGHQNQWKDTVYGNDMVSSDDSGEMGATKPFEPIHLSDQNLVPKRKTQQDDAASNLAAHNLKKKARSSNDREGKNIQLKKNQKAKNDEADENVGLNLQTSSGNTSEDESIVSQEQNGTALNLNEKTRAGRGSATDPQSLYARKRRERINERLRILQNLVPNGTKVDISTMLEEAVQYVKFLQLQIKLLSSDDLWMYAPIAYNGMDIGLDLKISQP